MDQDQKTVLLSKRVELVENLDMTGGLYTQLLARKVLNQRKVNEFKLQRTPEAQAEELLSFLPKRDCFQALCDALIADDQEDIVDKYLKLPTKTPDPKVAAPEPSTDTQSQTSSCQHPEATVISGFAGGRETPDCSVSPKKRPVYTRHPSSPSPAVLCIKESDEKHVYIKYDNPPSPAKRQRTAVDPSGAILPYNGDDNTRYALKHYVANEEEVADSGGRSLALHPSDTFINRPQIMVLENRQSVSGNANISEPSRYVAAFARQQAEKPYESSVNSQSSIPSMKPTLCPSPLKLKGQIIDNSDNISPSIHEFDVHGDRVIYPSEKNFKSVFQTHGQNSMTNESSPKKNSPYFSNNAFQSSNIQFMDPQKYLQQTGVLPSVKGSENRRNGSYDPSCLYKGDSLDSMSPAFQTHHHGVVQVDSSNGGDHLQLNAKAIATIEEENNELEIDLPDGCVNVKVDHSTRQFFLTNFKKSYPMRQIPRGLALVINVDEVEGKPPRKGTNFDRDNLCNLLTQLHFNIVVYNDNDGLSAQEIVNKLKAFAKLKEHHNYDACFICLLSHGEEGYIFGTDGKRIPLEEIFMLFGNTNCKGLIGKPKVFIIQACRGGTLDKGVRMDDEPDGGTIPAKAPVIQQMPSMSDMLICYPTLMGYYAWRNRARGSWYIEAIVQVFMRYAKNEDICAMLNRVNQVVSKKVSECNQKEMNQMSQMSEYKSTLRQPHLFLFPGIGCSGL